MEETIGMRVRKLRLAARMTQQELALKMGRTSRSYINKLELDHRDFGQADVAMLSEIFNVSPTYLILGLTDDKTDHSKSDKTKLGIGKRIRQRRKELGLSQEELAKKIGVGKTAVSNYEVNVSSPNETVLIALFEALQCDANYLYFDYIKSGSSHTCRDESDERLLNYFHKLNTLGKDKAIERVQEMTEVPFYITGGSLNGKR